MQHSNRKKRWATKTGPLFVIIGLLFWTTLPHTTALYAEPPLASGVEIKSPQLTSLEDGVILTWSQSRLDRSAPFELWRDGLIERSDFNQTEVPGEPILPIASYLIVLPDTAEPRLEMTQKRMIDIEIPPDLPHAPFPSISPHPQTDATLGLVAGRFDREPTPTENILPHIEPIHFEEIGRMRGVRLGRLTFYPITIDPAQERMGLVTDLQVTLHFDSQPTSAPQRAELQTNDPLLASLQTTVANPEHLPRSTEHPKNAGRQSARSEADLYLEVSQAGLYEISYEALQNSLSGVGENLSGKSPHNYELQHNGDPISLYWDGDADEIFEPGERFLFYASPFQSRWSQRDVYGLVYQPTIVNRMASRQPDETLPTGTAQIATPFEEDNHYTPNCICGQLPAGVDGERWVWAELRQPGTATFSYSLDIDDIDPNLSTQLDLWFIGFTSLPIDPDHKVDISAGGTALGSIEWDGKTAVHKTLAIPAGTITGNETLNFMLDQIGTIDGVWLDRFQLTYTSSRTGLPADQQWHFQIADGGRSLRLDTSSGLSEPIWAFDISDPARPIVLWDGPAVADQLTLSTPTDTITKTRFVASADSQLGTPALIRPHTAISFQEGDYILIGPAEFEATLAPLISLRSDQGLQPTFVSFESIVDRYGFGQPTPEAIRAFLADAYATWQTTPGLILLVGDGTYDPKQNQPNSKATILPVYFANVDPWAGEIPADNRYVTIDGDDLLPDMAIGRLPVNDIAELENVVAKLVAYPNQNKSWRKTWTFVSDDTDLAGNFAHTADEMISLLESESSPYQGQRHTYAGDEASLNTLQSMVEQTWNSGSGHFVYNGHSTVHQWGDESFFHFSQIGALNNLSKPSIVLQMTCFTGSYQMPGLDSLDEALLRHPQGGAIAVWGATGLGVSTGHEALSNGYITHLLQNGTTTIGAATLAGKLELLTNQTVHTDLVDTFTLLGDPAMQLRPPGAEPDGIFLPYIQR